MRVWEHTLRYEVDDRAGILGKSVTENYIGALWHNRLLIFPLVLRRFFPNRPGSALISASRDGDLLTDAIHRFGYDVIRGSSSRLGASAILQLTEELASGRDVVITPDGPRGPAYELGPGIVFLAQKSGASVLPMNLEYSRCWRLGSWDRFIIPQPFSLRIPQGRGYSKARLRGACPLAGLSLPYAKTYRWPRCCGKSLRWSSP